MKDNSLNQILFKELKLKSKIPDRNSELDLKGASTLYYSVRLSVCLSVCLRTSTLLKPPKPGVHNKIIVC